MRSVQPPPPSSKYPGGGETEEDGEEEINGDTTTEEELDEDGEEKVEEVKELGGHQRMWLCHCIHFFSLPPPHPLPAVPATSPSLPHHTLIVV